MKRRRKGRRERGENGRRVEGNGGQEREGREGINTYVGKRRKMKDRLGGEVPLKIS